RDTVRGAGTGGALNPSPSASSMRAAVSRSNAGRPGGNDNTREPSRCSTNAPKNPRAVIVESTSSTPNSASSWGRGVSTKSTQGVCATLMTDLLSGEGWATDQRGDDSLVEPAGRVMTARPFACVGDAAALS